MNAHPYAKAYMAGVTVPTMFLLVILAVFVLARLILQIPVPLERIIVAAQIGQSSSGSPGGTFRLQSEGVAHPLVCRLTARRRSPACT